MGKTAPARQKGGISAHSRAARRATSPGIDTDKSLKDVKPPTESVIRRPSVLAAHQGAGVTKKSKNGRKAVLSAKARRRHEKGMDRAEAVMDKKGVKVEKSRGRARTVQERAKNWEELNKKLGVAKPNEGFNILVDEGMSEDDTEEEVEENGVKPQSLTLPEPVEDGDEIL